MENSILEIDQPLLQRIINKRRFDISAYDYFIYITLCIFSIVIFCFALYIILQKNKSALVLYSSVMLASAALIGYLFIIVRSFFDTFFFKRIATNNTAERTLPAVLKLLIDKNISGQQSRNAPNILTCFEYYSRTRSLIETTIIVLDNYLLINSRSKNTSKVFLHRTEIIKLIRRHFPD